MNNMEHMDEVWEPDQEDGGKWVINSLPSGWCVCRVDTGLPDDSTGEETAKRICAEHNRMLEEWA